MAHARGRGGALFGGVAREGRCNMVAQKVLRKALIVKYKGAERPGCLMRVGAVARRLLAKA